MLVNKMQPTLTLRSILWASFATAAVAFRIPFQAPLVTDDDDELDTPLPLVIWHGLGDSFNNPSIKSIGELADSVNPGTFTYVIQLGKDPDSDRRATFFGNLTQQLDDVCAALAAHPILSTAPAIDAIGFSQGGQFLRGYVERCNKPPVRSLVTFGSQHNGVVDLKACGQYDVVCRGAMALFRSRAWSAWVQSNVVPAQYYRDPTDYDRYLEASNFLADINNERVLKNKTYAANIADLVNFVMVMFHNDTHVVPKESAWFEEVNGTVNTPLRARLLYTEDWLGLRSLDRKGGLQFLLAPGDHMNFSTEFLTGLMKDYFGPLKKAKAQEASLTQDL